MSYWIKHCRTMLAGTQFMHTFIMCNNLQEELIMGLDMQQLHHLGCNWTENGFMFLHQGPSILINSIGTAMHELH